MNYYLVIAYIQVAITELLHFLVERRLQDSFQQLKSFDYAHTTTPKDYNTKAEQ